MSETGTPVVWDTCDRCGVNRGDSQEGWQYDGESDTVYCPDCAPKPTQTVVVPIGSAIIDAEDVAEARRIVAGWDDGTLDDRNTARQAVALLRRIGGEG